MSDDFGTVNIKRGDRAREIEVLRQQYRTHRESLSRLIADAPTEALAGEYQRLIAGIDSSLRKLDELEGRGGTAEDFAETQRVSTSPGMRPLTTATPPPPPPPAQPSTVGHYVEPAPEPAGTGTRMVLIVAGGIIVLGIIGWLIWRASSERRAKSGSITETTSTSSTAAAGTESPIAPAPSLTETTGTTAAGVLKIVPALHDYGVIRKGTRSVHQFDITNSGASPIDIQVARSTCKCLFYEYNGHLAPKKKESITVTVDGAKAKPGALEEQIAVTAKRDPLISATFTVRATIK